MGDVNQQLYLKRFVPQCAGPVLEVGSKDYGNTSSFRDVYTGCEYVGIDMEPGKNVDRVVDLVAGTGGLPEAHFALAICCSVLEHVRRPWVFAEHLARVIRPGGTLYMSVPWVWRYHAYPDDYFRFSWRGIMELFPQLEWSAIHYSSNVPGELMEIPLQDPGVDDRMAAYFDAPGGKRKYLPYLMVNMLGTRK